MPICFKFEPNQFKVTICRSCLQGRDRHQLNAISTLEDQADNHTNGSNVNDDLRVLADKIKKLNLKQLEDRLLKTIAHWRDSQIQTANELLNRSKQEAAAILHRNENDFERERSRLYKDIEQLEQEMTDLAKNGEATDCQRQAFEQRLEEIQSSFDTIQHMFVRIGTSSVQIGLDTIGVVEAKPKTLLSEGHRIKINQFIGDAIPLDQSWQLIYKGQNDGFKSEDFHRCCDGKGPTITLVQTKTGLLFGGYTTVSWTSDGKHKSDFQAFLFTLINPYEIPPTKFEIKPEMIEDAVLHEKNLGPVFGDRDLVIVSSSNEAGPNPSFSRFPTAYNGLTENSPRLFGDVRSFLVNELEVYIKQQFVPPEEQFATPGAYSRLKCGGRACARCKKCRDWCTKKPADWDRMRNIVISGKVSLWNVEHGWEYFERRVGYTCAHVQYYPDRRNNLNFDDHCMCIDNRKVDD